MQIPELGANEQVKEEIEIRFDRRATTKDSRPLSGLRAGFHSHFRSPAVAITTKSSPTTKNQGPTTIRQRPGT